MYIIIFIKNVLRWCPFVHLFDAPFQNSVYGHETKNTYTNVLLQNCYLYLHFYSNIFSCSGLSLTNTGDSKGDHCYSTLLLRHAQEHCYIYFHWYIWNLCPIFLTAAHVITRLLLDEIYLPLGISVSLSLSIFCLLM